MSDQEDWRRLLHLYRHTAFGSGHEAVVTVQDESVLGILRDLDNDKALSQRFNVVVDFDLSKVKIGHEVDVLVGAAMARIGLLVDDVDAFLNAADVKFREPLRFFVKSDGTNNENDGEAEWLQRYRAVLKLTSIVGGCSLFTDETRSEIVFFKDGRLPIPVSYSSNDMSSANVDGIFALVEAMSGEHHIEQRQEILAEAIASSVGSVPRSERFSWIIRNSAELALKVKNGYRLFASSFSYDKIRGDVQKAQSEYLTRIHKTFVDIQGQLLGLPVATVVVASQMKEADGCGLVAWSNLAILGGSYLFVVLFVVSCLNQGFTLWAIGNDVAEQRRLLATSYAPVSEQFVGVFDHLRVRIGWHYIGIFLLCFVAISGGVLTTMAFQSLTAVNPLLCGR